MKKNILIAVTILSMLMSTLLFTPVSTLKAAAVTDPFPDFYTAIPDDDIIAYLDANPGVGELTVHLDMPSYYEQHPIITQFLMEKIQQAGILFNVECWGTDTAGKSDQYFGTWHINGNDISDVNAYSVYMSDECVSVGFYDSLIYNYSVYNFFGNSLRSGISITLPNTQYFDQAKVNVYTGYMSGYTDYMKMQQKGITVQNGMITIQGPLDLSNVADRQIYVGAGYYGDVDNDGDVTAADALMVLKASVRAIQLTDLQAIVARLTRTSNVTAADALTILKYSIGIPWYT